MKKYFFVCLILLFSLSFTITTPKSNIFAADKTATCGEGCNYSYGETVDAKAYPSGAVICPKECPKCQPKSLGEYYNYNVCTEEDYEPGISDLGGEALVEEKTQTTQKAKEDTEYPEFGPTINKFINISITVGGIIAFILIIAGAFQIILSAGNPDRVKAGKEMITSAIAGLLLIIFAVFILRLIGYDILKIPGFGE